MQGNGAAPRMLLDEAIAAERSMLDRAEAALAMAGERGNQDGTRNAMRVMACVAARLDRLESLREAQAVAEANARADEIFEAADAMVGHWKK